MSRPEFAHPEALVSTEWVAEHLASPEVRVLEVDYNPDASYRQGHVPGAVLVDWRRDINHRVRRDIVDSPRAQELLSRCGVLPRTTLVLYGDFSNWFAAFALWVFRYYGLPDVRLMDGGRRKWIEEGRPLTQETPPVASTEFPSLTAVEGLRVDQEFVRARLDDVMDGRWMLIDVRSPAEFHGEVTAPPEYPNENAQRSGHIPGARNVPWSEVVRPDGTFKSREELDELYRSWGIVPERPVITYCRIGERSSHTWFVLKYLLGYPDVRNYDGSWAEWGNRIGVPIERP